MRRADILTFILTCFLLLPSNVQCTVDTILVSDTELGRWERIVPSLPTEQVGAIRRDRSGALWLIARDHVIHVRNGVETRIDTSDGLHPGSYRAFAESDDGRKWIAGDHHGRLAISWTDGETWTSHISNTEGVPGGRATVDDLGNLWVNGQNPNFFEDRGGTGVYRYDGEHWTNFREPDLISERVYDVLTGPDGSVWVATLQGVSRYLNGVWTSYTSGVNEPLEHGKSYSFLRDGQDRIWVMHGYRGVSVYDGTTWTKINEYDGMFVTRTRRAAQLTDDTLWFTIHPHDISSPDHRGMLRFDGISWTLLNASDGVPFSGTEDLIDQNDGSILVVAANREAYRFTPDAGGFARLSGKITRRGTPVDNVAVYAVTEDGIQKGGTRTVTGGTFELTVPPGAYTIEVHRSLGGDARAYTVEPGDHIAGIVVDRTLVLEETGYKFLGGLTIIVLLLACLGLPIFLVVRWISRKPLVEDDDPDPNAQQMQLTFHGTGGALFGIYIVNIFLSIVTLGIYYFWGKARVRAYVYSQTALAGERFANHMTGRELLIGWIKAIVFILLLTGLTEIPSFFWESQRQEILTTAIFYLLLIFGFLPFAIVGSWRYRASRSEWRGIRFSSDASGRRFFWIYLGGTFVTMLTLGLYTPWFENRIRGYLTEHTRYGTGRFTFDGNGRDLFKYYLLAYLLTPLTLGFSWFWYEARKTRYFWSRTTFEGVGFTSTVTGSKLMSLKLGNAILFIFTLGLAQPWITVRNSRFFCDYLLLADTPDWDAVTQDYDAATATGEGLSDYLDFEFEF